MTQLKRILLVEDNPKDIDLTLAVLEESDLDHEVAIARDGTEALDYLYHRGKFAERAAGLPAVVLLDLKMPKLDGLEVLRLVKADPKLKKLPVVMVTSSRESQDLTTSYELGANAYVVKPTNFQQFTERLKQLISFWTRLNEPPPDCA